MRGLYVMVCDHLVLSTLLCVISSCGDICKIKSINQLTHKNTEKTHRLKYSVYSDKYCM
jgi:hypothetical protein